MKNGKCPNLFYLLQHAASSLHDALVRDPDGAVAAAADVIEPHIETSLSSSNGYRSP